MDGVFFIFDSLVLVGGSPSHTSGSLTFPVARDCYERSIPKARNKGVVRIATATYPSPVGVVLGYVIARKAANRKVDFSTQSTIL